MDKPHVLTTVKPETGSIGDYDRTLYNELKLPVINLLHTVNPKNKLSVAADHINSNLYSGKSMGAFAFVGDDVALALGQHVTSQWRLLNSGSLITPVGDVPAHTSSVGDLRRPLLQTYACSNEIVEATIADLGDINSPYNSSKSGKSAMSVVYVETGEVYVASGSEPSDPWIGRSGPIEPTGTLIDPTTSLIGDKPYLQEYRLAHCTTFPIVTGLEDIASTVNSEFLSGKVMGAMCIQDSILYVATGHLPESTWVPLNGTTTITPAPITAFSSPEPVVAPKKRTRKTKQD